METLINIVFYFAILTSHICYVVSETEKPEIPSVLNAFGRNNIDVAADKLKANTNTNSRNEMAKLFDRFRSAMEHTSDANISPTSNPVGDSDLASSPSSSSFLPLNTSADEITTSSANTDDKQYFFDEENDDGEDDTDNDDGKEDSDEYKDDDDYFVLDKHANNDHDDDGNNDDDDEEYDVTKWTQHGGDEDDIDYDSDLEDDFDETKSHLGDELIQKSKQPTAPTNMVLFYTWMIVAVLLIVIGVSTFQTRCKGVRIFGSKASNAKDDRKRLMEHEFV